MKETLENMTNKCTEHTYTSPVKRMYLAELVRQRARTLRERSVRLDRLADELNRCSFSDDSSQELMIALARE